MRVHLILLIATLARTAVAQMDPPHISPQITTSTIQQDAVSVLRLGAGYTTSVRVPDEISSVVIGDPLRFKAEHSDAEPRLVFLKPTTAEPSESNALITTRTGREISLHLVSFGTALDNAQVDFFVDYQRPRDLLVDAGNNAFLIADTRPVSLLTQGDSDHAEDSHSMMQELEQQKGAVVPKWEGKELLGALGASTQRDEQTVVAFSVLNDSHRWIELLPPQVEIVDTSRGRGRNRLKSELIAVIEYRMTTRKLAPGERADGVAAFARPAFKESTEQLQLQLAEAERIDHPIRLSVPFVTGNGGFNETK